MKKIQMMILLGAFLLSGGFFLQAEDGMWMPHQMKDLDLVKLGLRMNPADLYKKDGTGLMSAIVHLGGGTGEFVSPEGLILTNHHVAFGALQRASTEEADYIRDGFLANGRAEEIPAQGYIADVLLGYEDITQTVTGLLPSSGPPLERYEALESIKKDIIAEAEKAGADIRAVFASMYSGNRYYLFRFKRIKDIRLVYAPPLDLGNFGGDIDNWMWPRHTCDFSFLRAYVSRENIGSDYSPNNVPYTPKSFLTLSTAGFREGDFSFVMGYPGRTYRNYTAAEMRSDTKRLQSRILLYKETIDFLEDQGRDSRDVQIKYAGTINGLNNSLKNYQGKIEGMEKVGLMERKKMDEEAFLDWAGASADRKQAYGSVLSRISDHIDEYEVHSEKNTLLNQLTSASLGSALLSQAHTIVRTVLERSKPDREREAAYQERNLSSIRQGIRLADRRYDLNVDREFLKFRLNRILSSSPGILPSALQPMAGDDTGNKVAAFVDRLYSQTSLADTDTRLRLIDLSPAALREVKDPFLDLAFLLEKEMESLRTQSRILDQKEGDAKKPYLQALLESRNGRLAPDANSTIRYTYGFIRGYSPRDGVEYLPQTTLSGVMEKDTGEFPFNAPPLLRALHDNKDFGPYADKSLNDIPACFLNTTMVTGGSSGSPTLDADGNQIGIIFDMTYESVTGDYLSIPELQRTISVDIRFVLFVTEKFSGARHIIDELSIRN
ncbi:MAG: S46 family peptidase [Acidobacteriota bacterium]